MAEICLILEGTYPYVVGGVSNWVQMLVSGLPEFDFSVAHFYTGKEPEEKKYNIPINIKTIKNIPLMINEDFSSLNGFVESIPDADIYHALSTGFAGLAATEIKSRTQRPFILTEHGIYWHEIELGADEIECGFKIIKTDQGELKLGKTWQTWGNTFKNFAKSAYHSADAITTVCNANAQKQFELNANEKKCSVIPNGVDVSFYSSNTKKSEPGQPVKIALIGRVTPIKEIEIFIRSCAFVKQKLPGAEFFVIGPINHDTDYYNSCLVLKEKLGLQELAFTGEVDLSGYLDQLDVVVLTSKSEGQPFVLLESMAAGIPVVATDVGGCCELVNGFDDGMGSAGEICSVGDVAGISAAIFKICANSKLWYQYSQTGKKRVEAFYSKKRFLESYKSLYSKHLGKATG